MIPKWILRMFLLLKNSCVERNFYFLLHYMEEDGKGGRNWQAEWRKCMWSLVIPRDFLLPSINIFFQHIWINANFSELVFSHAMLCLVRFFLFLGCGCLMLEESGQRLFYGFIELLILVIFWVTCLFEIKF
jgi:hypothetical protein